MMKEKDLPFVKSLIENITEFELSQIEYKTYTNSNGDVDVTVWSPNAHGGNFYATGIIPSLQKFFGCYVAYNQETRRVELNIH